MTNAATSVPAPDAVAPRLSTLDRFLPVWIGVAMAAGLLLGRLAPSLGSALSAVEVEGISLPIATGLLVMMYPVLAKVRYDQLDEVTADRKLMVSSLLLNWLIGPAVMFMLAWLLLADLPEYRMGLIIVGLARCIAMVIIWNDLACGDREAAAVLVALNSIFQVVMFAVLGWFYLSVLPGWLGLPQTGIHVSAWQIAKSVLIFLGIPLLAGFLTRRLGEKAKGRYWYETRLVPRIGPWRCMDCCSPSLSCLPYKATRSPHGLGMSPALRCRCSRISRSCGPADTPSDCFYASAMPVPPRWRSPPPATTSSWPSRWRSPPTAQSPAKLWPVSLGR